MFGHLHGVVLHELITYGRPPYPGMTNGEVLAKIGQGYCMPLGLHLDVPAEKLYDMMLKCLREDPKDRPTFTTLQRELTGDSYRANAS